MADGQFRDLWYELAPPWLRTDNGEKYMYVLETMRDILMEKLYQAVAIRIPGKGDPSQIPYLAYDRQLVQGPLESNASFIQRIVDAFETWAHAGSALAVLGQLQAYVQGRQTGTGYLMSIVSAKRRLIDTSYINAWWSLRVEDPIGTQPLLFLTTMNGANFIWDNKVAPWRNWLVLYQHAVTTGQSGASASTLTASGFTLADPGHNVGGVWVPRTSGFSISTPFLTVTGLAGLTQANVGDMLNMLGGDPDNDGTFQIVQVVNPTTCVIVSPTGAPLDAGPIAWSIFRYPWLPPNLARGAPGQVRGSGETIIPPVDTGSNVQGNWQPTSLPGAGSTPTYSRGLRVSSLEIDTIRGLVKTWKSAGTYYPNIIISYDTDEFDRLGTSGINNPDNTFGDIGTNTGGVWVPTRMLNSQFDCYCQGTGRAVACSVENVT